MAFTLGVGSLSVAALFCGTYLLTYLGRCMLAWHRYQKAPRQRVFAALFALSALGVTVGGFVQPMVETFLESPVVRMVTGPALSPGQKPSAK